MSFSQTKSKKTAFETNESDIQPIEIIHREGKHVTFNEEVSVILIESYKSYYNQFENYPGMNCNDKDKCVSCGCVNF